MTLRVTILPCDFSTLWVLAPAFRLAEVEVAHGVVKLVLCFFVEVSLVAFERE